MNIAASVIAALVTGLLTVLGTFLSPRWLENHRPTRTEYIVLALLGLGLGAALGYSHGLAGLTWQYCLLTSALLVASFVDLKEHIIPNEVVLATLVGAVLLQAVLPAGPWLEALYGLLFGFGSLLVLALAYRGGMGFGDVKIAAAIGFVLTWRGGGVPYYFPTIIALLLAFILGGVVSLGLLLTRRVGRKDAIPFGPFLATGAIVVMLWGMELTNWYLGVEP
jgi:leader peptidase (prepilin peptidase)/N-methyltransferase